MKRELIYVAERQSSNVSNALLQLTVDFAEQEKAEIVVVVRELADEPYMSREAMSMILDIVKDYELDEVVVFASDMVNPCRNVVEQFDTVLRCCGAELSSMIDLEECGVVEIHVPFIQKESNRRRRKHLTTTFFAE